MLCRLLTDLVSQPDEAPPEGHQQGHEDAASGDHARGEAGVVLPVQDGVNVPAGAKYMIEIDTVLGL